jgi:hypothetical protein
LLCSTRAPIRFRQVGGDAGAGIHEDILGVAGRPPQGVNSIAHARAASASRTRAPVHRIQQRDLAQAVMLEHALKEQCGGGGETTAQSRMEQSVGLGGALLQPFQLGSLAQGLSAQ